MSWASGEDGPVKVCEEGLRLDFLTDEINLVVLTFFCEKRLQNAVETDEDKKSPSG